MSLATVHQKSVPISIRRRGASYHSQRRVKITEDSSDYLSADVRGTELYSVDLGLEIVDGENFLVADCDCPYSEKGEVCKHIWATIIEAGRADTKFNKKIARTAQLIHASMEDEIEFLEDAFRNDHRFDTKIPDEIDLEYDSINNSYGLDRVKKGQNLAEIPESWQSQMKMISSAITNELEYLHPSPEKDLVKKAREISYHLDLEKTAEHRAIVISFHYREMKKNGEWGVLRKLKPGSRTIFSSSQNSKEDSEIYSIVSDLSQFSERSSYYEFGRYYSRSPVHDNQIILEIPHLWNIILPKLCKTNRFFICKEGENVGQKSINPLLWDKGEEWRFRLRVEKDETGNFWLLKGLLFRDGVERELNSVLIFIGNIVVFDNLVATFEGKEFFKFIEFLYEEKFIKVPLSQQNELVAMIFEMPVLPPLDMPKELKWKEVKEIPIPEFNVLLNESKKEKFLNANLAFNYGEELFLPGKDTKNFIADRINGQLILRDLDFEEASEDTLRNLDIVKIGISSPWQFKSEDLSRIVLDLNAKGWVVKAEGKKLKPSGNVTGKIKSGIDWFELTAKVDFEGYLVGLPSLLKAIENNQNYVTLGDGSVGILPEEWLEKYGAILKFGNKSGSKLKYRKSQVAILDALLDGKNEIETDQVLTQLRNNLKTLRGIKAVKEPVSFSGELREYQREGLGWLQFLTKFQLGGCLADDMGLGKTVQILAMLVWFYSQGKKKKRPSLIVMPRSLIYNWTLESQRFSKLRVLDYSTPDRFDHWEKIDKHHIILTTYAILRSDIEDFSQCDFEYAILDEAQAIKNETSQVAKASRLINAKFRLAMSGTPIENHLGELWSIFEFINPGFLGSTPLKKLTEINGSEPDESALKLLSRAISPFILRRTKEQVLKDLPPKTEQTVFCELSSVQRKKYDELKKYYRASLDSKIKEFGLQKSQMHVLEALLRLRQAACHTALIDSKNEKKHSAKTETLMEQVHEIVSLGHKVLIFSQFTKMLSIVKGFMDKAKIEYEYLDGKTKKRQDKVDRFQKDKNCQVFLISLKAGGVGLNLTAADYCFILDPWWNPAVEAQAVDRMHRIGQKKHVFAYRYIAKNTVEEKILQLQSKKKKLSEGLITANSALIKGLSQKDLEFLLS